MMYAIVLHLIIALAVTTEASPSVKKEYCRLGDTFTLKFNHSIKSLGGVSCSNNNVSLLTYSVAGFKLHGRWKTRAYQVNELPSLITVVMTTVEEADDGTYVCKVSNEELTKTETPIIIFETYSPTKIIEDKMPAPKDGKTLEYFLKDTIPIELTSNCSKPPIKYSLTTTSQYSVNSTSTPCRTKPNYYGKGRLVAEVEVNETMEISISVDHPSIADMPATTFTIKLRPLCDKEELCGPGETCTGSTTMYNCTCPEGYVNDTGNGTICSAAHLGQNKAGGIKLGTGAIVGIAVGCVAAIVIVVVVVTLLLRRQKSQKSGITSDKKGGEKKPEAKEAGTGGGEKDKMLQEKKQTSDNKDSGVEDETKPDEDSKVKVDMKAGEVTMTP